MEKMSPEDKDERTRNIEEAKKSITSFLKSHTCYDLMPTSGKSVVFNVQIPINLAFYALVEHEIKAAPLWDDNVHGHVGMITATDIINVLRYRYKLIMKAHKDGETWTDDMDPFYWSIQDWRNKCSNDEDNDLKDMDIGKSFRSELNYLLATSTLYEMTLQITEKRIHRLPVMDMEQNIVLCVTTLQRLLKYVVDNFKTDVKMFSYSIQELNLGVWGSKVVTVSHRAKMMDVLSLLISKNVSGVPVLDDEEKVINCYCRTDVVFLAKDTRGGMLDRSVGAVLEEQIADQAMLPGEGMHFIKATDTLATAITRFAAAKVHRLVIIKDNGTCTGILSLGEIFRFIC